MPILRKRVKRNCKIKQQQQQQQGQQLQQQTLITSKTLSVLKTEFNIQVKIVSVKTATNQNSLQKIWDQSITRLGNN